jgi:hypothetical protein
MKYLNTDFFFSITRRSIPAITSSLICPPSSAGYYVQFMQQRVCCNKFLFEPPLTPRQDTQTVDPTQLLSVNCLSFEDEPTKAFTVKISKTDNVSFLKKKIKEEKSCQLASLDASDLILYKVSLPTVDIDSNTDSKATPSVTRIPLKALEKLKEVFPEPLQEDIVHNILPVRASIIDRFPSLT